MSTVTHPAYAPPTDVGTPTSDPVSATSSPLTAPTDAHGISAWLKRALAEQDATWRTAREQLEAVGMAELQFERVSNGAPAATPVNPSVSPYALRG